MPIDGYLGKGICPMKKERLSTATGSGIPVAYRSGGSPLSIRVADDGRSTT